MSESRAFEAAHPPVCAAAQRPGLCQRVTARKNESALIDDDPPDGLALGGPRWIDIMRFRPETFLQLF